MQLYDMNDLAESRADAEEGMLDTCKITTSDGTRVFNPETGQYTAGGTPVYEGKCRLKASAAMAATQESGAAVYTVERLTLQLPFGPTIPNGATVNYLTSDTNPNLIGNTYRVTGLAQMSQATAQRLSVELITNGN